MTFLFAELDVGDYESWKRDRFDADPAGRKQAGKGHMIYQDVDNPNHVYVGVEFGSAEEAASFRERLAGAGALDGLTVKSPPTIVEGADRAEY